MTAGIAPYRPMEQLVRLPSVGDFNRQLYVHADYGSVSHDGNSPERPLATLDQAINRHAGNNSETEYGCTIHLMPGHAETITAAAQVVADQPRIKVLGHGFGNQRPTFTFTTAIAADIDITGADFWLENCRFVNGIDNLTNPLDLSGARTVLKDIELVDTNSSYHVDDWIVTTAACDGLRIEDIVYNGNGGKTGGQTVMSIVGGSDIIIIPKWMWGDCVTAFIENVTTACTNLQIFGRASWPAYFQQVNAADVIATCVATTTGRMGPFLNARLADDGANITEAFVGADMEFFQPINIVNADGESSLETNITASTD